MSIITENKRASGRPPIRLISSCWAALTALVAVSGAVAAQQSDEGAQQIIIDSGFHAPDTVYLRRNIEELEKRPFDGVVTWISWPRQERGRMYRGTGEPGDMYNLCWKIVRRKRWTPEMVEPAIQDLKDTRFSRFRSNFIHVVFAYNTEPMDWFDDQWWDIICHNIACVAKVAKQGGCRGILIDPEEYGYALWNYRKLRTDVEIGNPALYKDTTFEQVHDAARKRGQAFVRAINSEFEDPIIFFFNAYGHIARSGLDRGEKTLDRQVLVKKFGGYLLAPFFDGMLEGASADTIFVDGSSEAKWWTKPAQFERQRRYVKDEALKVTLVPGLYRKKVRLGFCFRLSYHPKERQVEGGRAGCLYDPEKPESNFFSPDQLEDSIRSALEIGDGYALFWSERTNWWLDGPDARPADGVQMQPGSTWVPKVYWDAVERARRPAGARERGRQ